MVPDVYCFYPESTFPVQGLNQTDSLEVGALFLLPTGVLALDPVLSANQNIGSVTVTRVRNCNFLCCPKWIYSYYSEGFSVSQGELCWGKPVLWWCNVCLVYVWLGSLWFYVGGFTHQIPGIPEMCG